VDRASEPAESVPVARSFNCDTRGVGARSIVMVDGEIDLATAPVLLDALLNAIAGRGKKCVVADLTRVDFIDSSGVHALVVAQHTARARGADLIVRGPKPNVALVFELLGLGDQLTFESDDHSNVRAQTMRGEHP
jgi:anti-anti-sigma factor